VNVTEGRSLLSSTALVALSKEAERLGLKFESAQCSLLAGEVDLKLKRHAQARVQLESALAQADRLGARLLLAQAHHLLAIAYSSEGNQADSRRHSEAARQLVDVIRKDARGDVILKRSDLRAIMTQLPQ
jgi:hypothetical protein